MVKSPLFKHLRVSLSAILLSASLLILDSCNNKSEEKTENKDSMTTTVEKVDSQAMKDQGDRKMQDSTGTKDTTKGEQTPPPK